MTRILFNLTTLALITLTSTSFAQSQPRNSGSPRDSRSTAGQQRIGGNPNTRSPSSQNRTIAPGARNQTAAKALPFRVNTDLVNARNNVGPQTQAAIDAALAGKLLTPAQRSLLQGAIQNNTTLTASQKGAFASALQNDLDEKRQLRADNSRFNGNTTVVIRPRVISGGTSEIIGGRTVIVGGGSSIPSTVVESVPSQVVVAPATSVPAASVPAVNSGSVSGPTSTSTPTAAASTAQTIRLLSVENATKETLRVFVKLSADAEALTFEFAPGQAGQLQVGDKAVAAAAVLIWAESDSRKWLANEKEALVLVPQAYQANAPEVYTHRFAD